MKRKLYALFIGLLMMCSIVGCGETAIDANGIEHPLFGRFITLNEEEYYDKAGNYHRQYIAYDKDTKIMYIIDNPGYGISISPFYVMNSENEPVIGVYNGDLEDVE